MSGCQRETVPQPTATALKPVEAVTAVKTQFPQADQMVFTSIGDKHIWRVNFVQNSVLYSAATSSQKLLTAYQLSNGQQPDTLTSLTANTVIDGGTFSSFREQRYDWFRNPANNGKRVLADYIWQGTKYTYRWGITNINGGTTYVTEMLPFYEMEFRTESLADLPFGVQRSMSDQYLRFQYALVRADGQGRRFSTVYARQNNNPFELVYNNDGVLLEVSNLQNPERLGSLSDLPSAIQTYLRETPELAGFSLQGQFSIIARSYFGPLQTYRVNLQKGRQTWFMTFDGSGKLLSRSYLNLV